jgi:hypothetical protein
MAQINLYLADVQGRVNDSERAIITGKLGAWMMRISGLVQGVSAVQIGWSSDAGRPGLGPADTLVYVTTDVDRSIAANGGNASQAISDPKVLGLTEVSAANSRALSEVYLARAVSPSELAGAAFHETAHNKSLQDNGMHQGKDGLLMAAPHYGLAPTQANLDFLAKFILTAVKQTIVPQNTLKNAWYGPGSSQSSPSKP